MEDFAVIAGLILGAATWWALAHSMKINGRPWWWRHLAGSSLAPFTIVGASLLLASITGVTDQDGEPLGGGGFLGGLAVTLPAVLALVVSWRAAKQHHGAAPKAEPAPAPKAEPTPPPKAKPAPPPKDGPTPPPKAEPAGSGNLRFLYEDAKGDLSTREVSSWNASARYIKGYCLTRGALRTFRRDRIVSFLEGEHLLDRSAAPVTTSGAHHDRPLEILFIGFDAESRQEMEEEAELEGLKVRKSVTQNLDFLCAGPNTGPRKLAEARNKGIVVMDEAQFFELLDTGVLPSLVRWG
jgi:hypothetical protein